MQATGSTEGTNPIKSFGDYLKDIGKELGDAVMSNFQGDKIIQTMEEMEGYATDMAHQFGQGRENVVAMQAAMGDAAIKVKEMRGDMKGIADIQLAVAESLGRNFIAQGKTIEELFTVTEVTGQSTKTLVTNFKDAGFSVSHINKEMQSAVDVARSQGVSALAVSDKVVTNMSALNKFGFANGVEGLAKMAAQATSLRVDMGRTLTLAEDLWNPEKAIDLAASLQRLGVAQSDLLDPLRLMDLAQNDPAELQNQISEMSKQFVQLNEKGQFEIMPGARRQLKEIAGSLGMSYNELAKMAIGSTELEDKLNKIRFPDFANEDQQKLIANLAEMDSSTGEYKVTFEDKEGETVTKSITELNDKDIEQLGKASQPKSLEDLTKEQLKTSESIKGILESIRDRTGTALAGTRIVEQGRRATVEGYGVARDTLGGEKLQIESLRNALGSGFSELISSINKGDALGGLSTAFVSTGEYIQGAFDEALKNGEKSINKLSESTNPLVEMFTNLGKTGVDFISKSQNIDLGGTTTVKAEDFVLETLPADTLKIVGNSIVGGTKLGGETPSEQTMTVGGNIDVNVNVTSQGIDATALTQALNDLTVKQQIVQAVMTGINPNINPNQLNQMAKSGEINSYNFG
jgi:hypothetical protein